MSDLPGCNKLPPGMLPGDEEGGPPEGLVPCGGVRLSVVMDPNEEALLDDLLQVGEGLTEWEVEFLDNLDKRWRGRELTEKQQAVLHRIAKKVGLER